MNESSRASDVLAPKDGRRAIEQFNPADFRPVDEAAHLSAAIRGSQYTGTRLFIALSSMGFGGGVFAYFFLRSLNSNGLWRPAGQKISPFISVSVLVLTLAACALYIWSSRRLGQTRNGATDWRVATAVAILLLVFAAGIQFWGLSRLPFFPGSSGFASVYVAVEPLFALWLLIGAVWAEMLLARSLRVRWIVAPVGENATSVSAALFAGSLGGLRAFMGFLGLLEIVLYILFAVLH
jgi:heme/copper-type cytochrome/quinol oxidase subunit 3